MTSLEDRLAPAVLTVNSLADGPITAIGSTLTLREAVALIDTDGRATDSAGNSLLSAKASQINTSSPFGSNDVIQFAPDLFSSSEQIVLNAGSLVLDQNVTILGPSATQLAINGDNQSTVFDVTSGASVAISGLTIEGGAATSNAGGGIVNYGSLTLTNTSIAGNSANQGNGGGIFNAGNLTLVDSTVSGNSALYNGGILNTGELTLTGSVVSENTVVAGIGGIGNDGGTLTLIDSAITGNSASGAGGIDNYAGGTATLVNTTVSGNSARFAGGIFNTANLMLTNSSVSGNWAVNNAGIANTANLTVIESSISGNSAAQGNGGIGNYGGDLMIVDCVVSGNSAFGAGGIGNYDNGTTTLVNTSVSGNSANFGGGIFNTANLTMTQSTVTGNFAFWNIGGSILNAANMTMTESTVSGNANPTESGIDNYGGVITLIDSTIVGSLADSGLSSSSVLPQTGAVPGNSVVVGIAGSAGIPSDGTTSLDTGTPMLASSIVSANLAVFAAGSVKASEIQVSDGISTDDDLTPIDNDYSEYGTALGVWTDTEQNGVDTFTDAMLADGAGLNFSATVEMEESGQSTGWKQTAVAIERGVALTSPASNAEFQRTQEANGQLPSYQSAWLSGGMAAMLVLWVSNTGCLTGQQSQPKEFTGRKQDRR